MRASAPIDFATYHDKALFNAQDFQRLQPIAAATLSADLRCAGLLHWLGMGLVCEPHIWRREGLKVPQKQPKRGRLWLNDGSCIRLRPEYPGHVSAYDFVEGRTNDGCKFRILAIIDEAIRECMALLAARRIRSADVFAILAELFIAHGPPARIRSDNGFGKTTVDGLDC